MQVAKRVPDAVFCLLTALRFHELTTQSPHQVWIALAESARKPRLDYPKLRVARFSRAALATGIEQPRVEGVTIRVYSPAKTVADCFKYQNKIGIDVAVEALRDFMRKHRGECSASATVASRISSTSIYLAGHFEFDRLVLGDDLRQTFTRRGTPVLRD